MAIRIAGAVLALLIGTAGTAFAGNRHGPITFEGNCEAAEEVVRRRHAREKKKA